MPSGICAHLIIKFPRKIKPVPLNAGTDHKNTFTFADGCREEDQGTYKQHFRHNHDRGRAVWALP